MLVVLSRVNPLSFFWRLAGAAPLALFFSAKGMDLNSTDTVTFDNSLSAAFHALSRSEIALASDC
jgi:hypothetical protein